MVMAWAFFRRGWGWNSGKIVLTLKLYFTPFFETSIAPGVFDRFGPFP
jgi:hypothetical protein